MLPEPEAIRAGGRRCSVGNALPVAGGEDVGGMGPSMVHENSYLPSRVILQRSEFLLPLDAESLVMYRDMVLT